MRPDTPDTMTKADFITGIVLVAFSTIVAVESWRMPRFENTNVNPYSVPGIVPGILSVIIMILGAVLIARSIYRGGHRLGWTSGTVKSTLTAPENKRLFFAVFLTVGYGGGLIGSAPYWLATFLFVFLFILIFDLQSSTTRARKTRVAIVGFVVAAVTSGLVTWVFTEAFLVTLP
ncbi:MAG: tripartite tricarboxylate transporter TctB family protein [Rhodospirillales bacterium]|nr:tripartite tricarboxylate transporter TctB family protein [Alphaproteobacteria bacterium]MBL6928079.1 tripartite tricarboxylate transporter TctB family protein [Rhodospirillales bacterium]